MRPRLVPRSSVIPSRTSSRPAPSSTETVDLLAQWMTASNSTRTSPLPEHTSGLRIAFYGRTSTVRHQDRVSSQGWQRDMANDLITGHGRIVAAYFDAGISRRVPWAQRPNAARLMAEISGSNRTIDAIVVGEYERAFTGTSSPPSTPARPAPTGPRPAPRPQGLDPPHGRRHPGEPALHRPPDPESPGHRLRRPDVNAGGVREGCASASRHGAGLCRRATGPGRTADHRWPGSPVRTGGLIHCGVCDRRLDSHWNHGRPTYRCRHGHTSTQRAGQPRPKTLYIREDHLVEEIDIRLGDQDHDGHAKLEPDRTRTSRVAVALRDSGRFVVCDSAGWRLEAIDSA
jgi:hypothetical protein